MRARRLVHLRALLFTIPYIDRAAVYAGLARRCRVGSAPVKTSASGRIRALFCSGGHPPEELTLGGFLLLFGLSLMELPEVIGSLRANHPSG